MDAGKSATLKLFRTFSPWLNLFYSLKYTWFCVLLFIIQEILGKKSYQAYCHLNSVQFSHSVVSDSLWPHELQHARPPCASPTPGVHQNSCPSSRWCHSAVYLLSSSSLPAPSPSQHQSLFQWVNSSHEMVIVLEFQLQHQSFQRTLKADLLLEYALKSNGTRCHDLCFLNVEF